LAKTRSYKYINLLFRLVIGLGAIWFIYYKVQDDFIDNVANLNSIDINYLALAFVLIFVNWGIEAFKWRYSIRTTSQISFPKAFNLTITGVTAGLLTPNRIGEIPFRALLLSRTDFKDLTLKTFVSSFSQLTITLLAGLLGVIYFTKFEVFSIQQPIAIVIITVISLFLIMMYFRVAKLSMVVDKIPFLRKLNLAKSLSSFTLSELGNILLLSLARYIVFFIQYYLVLKSFGVELVGVFGLMLIAVVFLITSIIPTILISEFGVRGSVALFIFGLVSENEIAIVTASIVLWVFNVGVPSLLGLANLKQIKLVGE
jgi:uncharacterized membrane protein YbhN (UPF0104 family)